MPPHNFVSAERRARTYITREEVHAMLDTSQIILPYEPSYTGHREAEKRREESRGSGAGITR